MNRHHRPLCFGFLIAAAAISWAAVSLAIADEPASDSPAAQPASGSSDKPADKVAKQKNPYLPRKGLSVEDLQAYIERMQEAPESIRTRPGFAAGLGVAAQRILDTDPKGSLRTRAVVTLLDSLHQEADLENDLDADKQLDELATKYSSDADKKIAADAAFYLLEQRMLKADELDLAKLPPLLDEVHAALKGQSLDARHLRIAAATVHAINRNSDAKEAADRLKQFGELFAASSDPILARYGNKLTDTGGPAPQTDWVGKPMELSGTTSEGAKFDIAQYKGKIVLVDFWATWCGPCRASMPELKELYEKYHARGLEIVGIDLDQTLSDLSDFLDKEKLPWLNVVGEEKDGQMQFPLAEKYQIQAIPSTFLVGKDGKIAAFDLRGEELAKAVEKMFDETTQPSSKQPAKEEPSEKK
jgi:thiol-disulfide isomerase/thioredoxin